MVFQLILPFLVAFYCLFNFLVSKLLWKLQKSTGEGGRSLLQKVLGFIFTEPSSDQNLKVNPPSL